MITEALIAHLETSLDGTYKTVAGALDLDRLANGKGGPGSVKPPAAYVVPQGDRAAASQAGIGETQQRLVERYIVVTALEAKNQINAAQAEKELEDLRQALRTAVVGWQPDVNRAPFLFVSGRLLAIVGGRVWWEDIFETDIWIRS